MTAEQLVAEDQRRQEELWSRWQELRSQPRDPLAHRRQRTICGAVWEQVTASAFARSGRTGTYMCTENFGHAGDHVGRLTGTTEGTR